MAGSLNRAQLIGNVGADPEIKTLNSGARIANIRLATSETWKDKSTGEKKERTEWHRIVVFNDGLVGVIEKYVTKGSKIFVEGQIQTRKWTDTAGVEKYSTEIVLQAFGGQLILLGGKGEGGGGERSSYSEPAQQRAQTQQRPAADLDDDIPF